MQEKLKQTLTFITEWTAKQDKKPDLYPGNFTILTPLKLLRADKWAFSKILQLSSTAV